ncbi:MAG: hypothetical protein HUU06_13430, partial [Planctomycetaceae bacterium]|nr:hypothetical protein [Planctomycetaceae bacterium]
MGTAPAARDPGDDGDYTPRMPDPAPGAGFSLLAASAADLRREGLADALGRALGMETEEAAE